MTSGCTLTTKQIEARRVRNQRQAAVAELERNGVEIDPKWQYEPLRGQPVEFISAADAVDIPANEFRNFERLTVDEEGEVSELLRPHWDGDSWDDFSNDDFRWELTPHQLRTLNQQKAL
jgi:hypothetical protein